MDYKPPKKIIENYAHVLVNFGLNKGKGIKKGDVVYVMAYETAKPLYAAIRREILKAGGHVISDYRPDVDEEHNMEREFYFYADDSQIDFLPRKYLRGLVDEADHMLFIDSQTDKNALKGIDPRKLMRRGLVYKPYQDWRRDKENQGRLSWTLALYPTPAMAKEAGLTLKEYWDQIIKACFLNDRNPIRKWKTVYEKIYETIDKLNKLKIERVHVAGEDADLWVTIGQKRKWLGGRGANIPSFEIFTSPDWRGTNGWIRFNQPLYRYGNLIKGIELEFKNGRVVKSRAAHNEKLLKQMIATPNADKVGEFSMTDKRFSRIDKFMAETLFDENFGGKHGNTHIALGNAYADAYTGNLAKFSDKEKERLGFNNSSVHTDIISTAPRTITAYWSSGKKMVIYQNGQFAI
jgi:aminopeptidase